MLFLSTAADDTPTIIDREPRLSLAKLRRQRDLIVNQTADVDRMLEGRRAGDSGFTGAGCRLTLAATRNVLEAYLLALKDVEAEVMPARLLPAVVSPAGAM